MRKLIRRIGILLFLAALVPSCELLEDCKSCTLVTVPSGGDPYYGSTATYCGTQLIEKEAEDVTIAGTRTYYDCQ
jgi:hypothetical protein